MSTQRHTPGPWTVKAGRYGAPHEISFAPKSYGVVARVMTPGVQNLTEAPGAEECERNAQLIAAAPDLLAALESLMQGTRGTSTIQEIENIKRGARAAINKARGQA